MKPGAAIVVLLVLGVFAYAFSVNYRQSTQGPITATSTSETIRYTSEAAKVSFNYPSHYQIESHIEGNAERNWPVSVLMEKAAAANIPQNSEAPPAITIAAYPNPEGQSAEEWIKGDARSNWKLSPAQTDGGLGSTSVGGEQALMYRYSGLYENDAVVVARGDTMYVFTVGWLAAEEKIRVDFNDLLNTVKFN